MKLDLSSIYNVLDYCYNQRDNQPGQSVCLVTCPPKELSQQYPSEGREGHDNSPTHVTLAYFGEVNLALENKYADIAREVCESTRSFPAKIGKVDIFENDDEDVYHSVIKSNKLHKFREVLKSAYANNQIQIDSKHPVYQPHITIEYVQKEQNRRFDVKPQGDWIVESAWLWGFKQPHLFHLR